MTSDNSAANNTTFKKSITHLIKKFFKKKDKDILKSTDFENLDIFRKDMIRGVLKLSSLNARDIMIPRVDIVSVESRTELKSLLKTASKAGHSRVPVYKEKIDNIIGIIYVKDLLELFIEKSRRKFQLKKILHEPYFVPETMPLDELLLEFKFRRLHLAVVVDEYGGVSGIVTLEDILEEIVGDIIDEFDRAELPAFVKTGENTYEVDSRMPIAEFNENMALALSQEEFDTIGGYVYDLFGKIPKKGETVSEGDLSFTIKDISGTVINRITVTVANPK